MFVYLLVYLLAFCLPACAGVCFCATPSSWHCRAAVCWTGCIMQRWRCGFPLYLAIQTKGKHLMVEVGEKLFRLASPVPWLVVVESSAKPDKILLVLLVVSRVLHQVGRRNYNMVQRSGKGPHGCLCSVLSISRARHFSKEKWNSACRAVLDQNTGHSGKLQKAAVPFPPILMASPQSFTISPSSTTPHTKSENVAVHICCWVLMLICAFVLWQLQCECNDVCWEQDGFSLVCTRKSCPRYWPR